MEFLHIFRFDYNRYFGKIVRHITFPEKLNLRPYMSVRQVCVYVSSFLFYTYIRKKKLQSLIVGNNKNLVLLAVYSFYFNIIVLLICLASKY